jgi:erythrin-vacuolar iron transport family protein
VCGVTSVFRPLLPWVARLRFDTFPSLSPARGIALKFAYGVVVCELLAISFIRYRFTGGKLANAIVQVVLGSGIAFAIGAWFGRIGVS